MPCRLTWTDQDGLVHERQPGTTSTTRCGRTIGASHRILTSRACPVCVDAALHAYCQEHDCSRAGCTTFDQ